MNTMGITSCPLALQLSQRTRKGPATGKVVGLKADHKEAATARGRHPRGVGVASVYCSFVQYFVALAKAKCVDGSYTKKQNVYLLNIRFEDSMRDAAINLRARPEQRDLIDQAATLLGKNRSDFMLEAACERARAVVLDQVFFSLDADKFQQFTSQLDAPVEPNAGLQRLMAVQAPWVTRAE